MLFTWNSKRGFRMPYIYNNSSQETLYPFSCTFCGSSRELDVFESAVPWKVISFSLSFQLASTWQKRTIQVVNVSRTSMCSPHTLTISTGPDWSLLKQVNRHRVLFSQYLGWWNSCGVSSKLWRQRNRWRFSFRSRKSSWETSNSCWHSAWCGWSTSFRGRLEHAWNKFGPKCNWYSITQYPLGMY